MCKDDETSCGAGHNKPRPLLPPSECNWLWAMAGDNKLTFDPPTRLPELTQNLIRSSHGHSVTPHLPWKFHANRSSHFLVMLLTKKQRNKQRNWAKTIRRPPTGGRVIRTVLQIIIEHTATYWFVLAIEQFAYQHMSKYLTRCGLLWMVSLHYGTVYQIIHSH